MGFRRFITLTVILVLVSFNATAQEKVTIGVMEFAAMGSASQDLADVLADLIAEKITRMGDVNVITKADILSVLAVEKQRRLAGCEDIACIIEEVGGALGMSWMVTGNVSKFGENLVLNLKLIDMRTTEVPSRVAGKASSEGELFDKLFEATHELFAKVADRLPLVPTVTIASRRIQLLEESPSAVSVYTREQIRASGAINLPDLLRRVPGLDVYEMKPSFPLVGARALTEHSNNLILVLVDGRESLIELSGWPIWAAPTIDLEEIERIEVIRGPGSALYGANAFAGVMSITTLPDRASPGADISLSGGESGIHRVFGRARGSYKLGGGTLDFSTGLGSLARQSPSDRDDTIMYTDFHSHGYLRYREGRQLDLSLHAGAALGGGTAYFAMGDFRTRNVINHFEMAKAEIGLLEGVKLKAQIYHIRFSGNMHYRTSIQSMGVWLANIPNIYIEQHTLDGQVQLDLQIIDNLLLTGGGNIRYTTNDSINTTPSSMFELRGAGFLQANWLLAEEFQTTWGLRFDLNNKTEGALSPRAAAVFLPWPDHSFRLGYGLAFRKPSFVENSQHLVIEEAALPEVVEKFATSLANEDLVNERVHSFEAGWMARFLDDRLKVSADFFYNIYVDMIYFATELTWDSLGRPNILSSVFEYRNQDMLVHAVGGEVEFAWKPSDEWFFWANTGVRYVFNEDGERFLSEPTLRVNIGCRMSTDWGFLSDIALHYVSTYEMPLYYPDETFEDPANVPLGNSWLAIGRLGYRVTPWQDRSIEAGLILRIPIGGPFREYPGVSMGYSTRAQYESDFSGEKLVRLAWFYLRSSF